MRLHCFNAHTRECFVELCEARCHSSHLVLRECVSEAVALGNFFATFEYITTHTHTHTHTHTRAHTHARARTHTIQHEFPLNSHFNISLRTDAVLLSFSPTVHLHSVEAKAMTPSKRVKRIRHPHPPNSKTSLPPSKHERKRPWPNCGGRPKKQNQAIQNRAFSGTSARPCCANPTRSRTRSTMKTRTEMASGLRMRKTRIMMTGTAGPMRTALAASTRTAATACQSQIINQNGLQTSEFEVFCFLLLFLSDPGTFDAGGPNRNTSRIQHKEV